jgi:multisubunit Na+/H+ antiporter MnhB subunit
MISLTKIISQINISEEELDIPKTAAADDNTVSTFLSFAFAIGAGIALIVIILAGIQFILSQGDPAKSAKARNAIIYAAIGLALCALAFSIVRFVLTRVS